MEEFNIFHFQIICDMEKEDKNQIRDLNEKGLSELETKQQNMMSCDDKCKLAVGSPVVNRLCNNVRNLSMGRDFTVLPNGFIKLWQKEGFVDIRESDEKKASTDVEKEAIIDDDKTRVPAMAKVLQPVDENKKS